VRAVSPPAKTRLLVSNVEMITDSALVVIQASVRLVYLSEPQSHRSTPSVEQGKRVSRCCTALAADVMAHSSIGSPMLQARVPLVLTFQTNYGSTCR